MFWTSKYFIFLQFILLVCLLYLALVPALLVSMLLGNYSLILFSNLCQNLVQVCRGCYIHRNFHLVSSLCLYLSFLLKDTANTVFKCIHEFDMEANSTQLEWKISTEDIYGV